ncbi:MFS allantoate transporter [Geopyxis carbonaria]|nr:MFS allantoate transporter [Geopyxis carbonaria]
MDSKRGVEEIPTATEHSNTGEQDEDHGYGTFLQPDGDEDTAQALFSHGEVHEPIDPEKEKKLVRKIDLRILPYLAVCYCFFYIDKTTLQYAAIFGLEKDLHLHGTQYNWLSAVFYFGFLAWAFPTNFLLQKLPVGRYLGSQIALWGFFLMWQAACTNFGSLATLRILGGAAEACSDPAFMLITSMWYTRRQQPIRIGLWYTANGLGIAGGGLLGYAIGHIEGSIPSWKYEFLFIGALCTFWGIVMFLVLPDSPVSARFLSEDERRMAVDRLREDQTGIENKKLKLYQVSEAFRDYKVYIFFLLGVFANIPNGGISNFGTVITHGFNFSILHTTLLQIPYGVIISISILTCVFINDRIPPNNRCYMVAAFMLPNIAGTIGLYTVPHDQKIARLMCYYLTGPYNASFVLILSLQIGNVAGHTKKVVTNAVLFLGYCIGNIAGPFFFKKSQSPTFSLGIAAMIFCHCAELITVLVLRNLLAWENRKRDKLQEGIERDLDSTAFADMTDRENLNFRYVY